MALLVGVGLAVALVYGLLSALVMWIRLSRAVVREPSHTFEVRCGSECASTPSLTVLGAPAIDRAAATVQLVSGSRTHTVMTRMDGDSPSRIEIPCFAVPRGLYRLKRVTVRFIGLLSLFAVVLEYSVPGVPLVATPLLRVLPEPLFVDEPPILPGLLSGTRTDGSSWDRSDELIEARPYHPGDDTRRINWNAYAHSEILFVRIGEEIPPPSRNAEIAVDARGLDSFSDIDRLISTALGIAERLEQHGFAVVLSAQVDEGGSRILGTIDQGRRALATVDPICGFLPDVGGPRPLGWYAFAPMQPGRSAGNPSRYGPHRGGGHALVVATDKSPAAPSGTDHAILLWDRGRQEGGGRAQTISLLD